MPGIVHADRRNRRRLEADGLLISLRRKGRLGRLTGMALDYNRHGVGLVLDQPLPKDATVYLSITGRNVHVNNVIGIVHNCISHELGFRCGIQFRTTSGLQSDQQSIQAQLISLESVFTDAEQDQISNLAT